MPARLLVVTAILGCSARVEDRPAPTPPPPAVSQPAPPPVAIGSKVDRSFGAGFEMRRPVHDGRLTVIPIVAMAAIDTRGFVTLQDGMAAGIVGVSEGATFETVVVSNRAREPLVILGGEILLDGVQDRVIRRNAVIGPRQSRVIAVHCAEVGRSKGSEWLRPGHALAERALRTTAAHGDQLAVWESIDAINARYGLAPPTGSYRHAALRLFDKANRARRDHLLEQLDGLEERDRMVGAAFAIDGRIIAIERFATPALYRQLETLLFASYLPGSHGQPRAAKPLEPADVRTFARTIRKVDVVETLLR